MFYLFLLAIAALAIGIYLVLVMGAIPGFKEKRFGVLEALPANLGEWQTDEDSPEARDAAARGEKREQRFLFEEGGLLGTGRLLHQVRYRDAESNQILRAEPERVVKRRRVRAAQP